MIGLGKGGSSLGQGLDPLMNSPIMQALRGNNQTPEMAGNAANLDLLKLMKGNHDYWRQQGQFNGEPQPSDTFSGPETPRIQPRQRSANQQSAPLVDVEELIRRRLGGR